MLDYQTASSGNLKGIQAALLSSSYFFCFLDDNHIGHKSMSMGIKLHVHMATFEGLVSYSINQTQPQEEECERSCGHLESMCL